MFSFNLKCHAQKGEERWELMCHAGKIRTASFSIPLYVKIIDFDNLKQFWALSSRSVLESRESTYSFKCFIICFFLLSTATGDMELSYITFVSNDVRNFPFVGICDPSLGPVLCWELSHHFRDLPPRLRLPRSYPPVVPGRNKFGSLE